MSYKLTQTGEEIQAILNKAVGADSQTISIGSNGWIEDASGFYEQEVLVTDLLATDIVIADIDLSTLTTESDVSTHKTEWGYIFRYSVGEGKLTFYAESQTSVALSVNLLIVR